MPNGRMNREVTTTAVGLVLDATTLRPLAGLWVEAWDAKTGEPAWQVKLEAAGKALHAPCGGSDGSVMYFSGGTDNAKDGGGETVAIDPKTGKALWRNNQFYCPGCAPPVVKDGRVLLAGWDTPMSCLSAKDGQLMWRGQKNASYWFNGPSVGPDFFTGRGYGGHSVRFNLRDGTADDRIMVGAQGFS